MKKVSYEWELRCNKYKGDHLERFFHPDGPLANLPLSECSLPSDVDTPPYADSASQEKPTQIDRSLSINSNNDTNYLGSNVYGLVDDLPVGVFIVDLYEDTLGDDGEITESKFLEGHAFHTYEQAEKFFEKNKKDYYNCTKIAQID
tara:strand:- start:74 stop:511 length:438 start_codon:yes stop_codon:yes gene_type:complete